MASKAIEIPQVINSSDFENSSELNQNEIENVKDKNITKKSNKLLKRIVISLSIALLSLMISLSIFAFFRIANYFETRFLPNTIINTMNYSHMTVQEVSDHIFQQTLDYKLEILGQDEEVIGVIRAADIGFFIDIDVDVATLMTNQNQRNWILEYSKKEVHEITYDIGFDYDRLFSLVREWEAFLPSNMEAAKDAYISEYIPAIKGYELVPETRGSNLDLAAVKEAIIEAVYEGKSQLCIADYYIRADITKDDANLVRRASVLNRFTGTKIVYDWNGSEVIVDGDLIHQWIIEEPGRFLIDEEAVRDFVNLHARENDTYGRRRDFTTVRGVTMNLPGGGFGWRTNRAAETAELIALIKTGAVGNREPLYTVRGWHKGQDDIGPSYVEIDLGNQRLYLVEEGQIILESELVSGHMMRGWGTPAGVFGITYKERNAILRGETYTTPVNYWMPFNGNIGMHDATWRRAFGGDIYIEDGSHGCINLPYSKAKEIHAFVSTGFPVICYY